MAVWYSRVWLYHDLGNCFPVDLHSGFTSFASCEQWKKMKVGEKSESFSVASDSLWPHGYTVSPWNSPGHKTGVGSLSLLPGNLPNPRIKRRSPTLQVDSLPAESQGKPKTVGEGSLSLLQGIFPTQGSNPGLEPRSPALQADSLPAEPQGKPKNTGVGSLSLLQGIFLTQGMNQGLQHCRQILYQLSYWESPLWTVAESNGWFFEMFTQQVLVITEFTCVGLQPKLLLY